MERFCKYCGKNISDTKLDRITCYSKECFRKHENFIRKNKKINNFCVICGCDISDKHAKAKICDNYGCVKEYRRDYYKNKTIKKFCLTCGEEFDASIKQTLCGKCRDKSKYGNHLKIIRRDIICENCGYIIETVEIYNSRNILQLNRGLCLKCTEEKELETQVIKDINSKIKQDERLIKKELIKKISRKNVSERMKCFNPMFKDGQTSKKIDIRMPRDEILRELSERMNIYNPMFNKETAEKVSKTLIGKYKNGDIIKLKGSDCPMWMGNRKFNKHIRISLRKYVKNELEISNFTCSICGKHGSELHAHHEEPRSEERRVGKECRL